MTIRDIAIAFGYEIDKSSEKKVEKSISSLKSMAQKALGAIGIGLSLVKVNSLIEECQKVNQKISAATKGLQDQQSAQEQILNAARNARASYSEMASTVTGLLNTHNKLFQSVRDTADFAELTNKAFKAAGASESSLSSLNSAVASAFTTGKLSAGGFVSLMNECPSVVTYLSKTLGTSERHVKALGTAGAITAKQLYNAFRSNADDISASYERIGMTVTDALKYIRSSFAVWITQLNDSLRLTETIAKIMVRAFNSVMDALKKITSGAQRLGKLLGGTENLLKFIAIAAASIFAASKGKEILGFLSAAKSLLGAVNLKLVAIAGVILIVALLLEDFIQFMRGNDSLIGTVLKEAGIDTDAFRERCKELWQQIKELLGQFRQFGQTLMDQFLSALRQIMPLIGKLLSTGIPVLLKLLQSVLSVVSKLAERILSAAASIMNRLLPVLTRLADKILTPLLDILETVTDTMMDIIDIVLPILTDLLDSVFSILETLFDALTPLLDLVGDLVSVLLQLAADILKPILQLVKELLAPLAELISDALQPILDLVNEIIEPLTELLYEILEPVIVVVKALAEVITDKLSFAVSNVTALLKPLIDILRIGLTTSLKNAAILIKSLVDFVKGTFDNMKQAFLGLVDFINGIFSGDWKKAWNGILSTLGAVFKQIFSIFTSLWDAAKSIGGNIVSGLREGFSAAWEGLKNAVKTIFDNVVGYFKKLFGIHSPSTVFADFGTMMMQGLINGLRGMESPVLAAVSSLGEKISGAFSGIRNGAKAMMQGLGNAVSGAWQSLKSGVSALSANFFPSLTMLGRSGKANFPASAGTGGSRVVNQYNEFVNTFHGDRAGQAKSAEAMQTASGDAVSAMARALEFAR